MAGAGVAAAATVRVRAAVPVRPAARTRIVVYVGYQLTVPASWPVYRLDQDPATCVRYDVHAVYLGTAGGDQQCPAGLIGRTETVSIVAASGTGAGGQGVALDAEDHDVKATLARDGQVRAAVVGTYARQPGAHPPGARHRAPGIRQGEVDARRRRSPGMPRLRSPRSRSPHWRHKLAPLPTLTAQPLAQLPSRPPRSQAQAQAEARATGQPTRGFDACTAPPMAAMKAWRRGYSVVGIYIGGVNAACDSGNLSAHWIAAAAKMGWSMLPVYVGPQAPCLGYGTVISYRKAAQEGAAVAKDAARDARRYGLRARSPIYYDMEGYEGNLACTDAVLEFLSAWTRELNARGYVSGVYSSWNSVIADMQSALAQNRRFTPPQAIWYALWDGRGNLGGNLAWPKDSQAKQFQGPHNSTIGGYTLDIDTDIVDGPVAR